MPAICKRRGVMRVRAKVMVRGKVRTKWWPDDSRASMKEATAWEVTTRKEMETIVQTTRTGTDCSVLQWANGLLDRYKRMHAKKTYLEKRDCFERFVAAVGADTFVIDLLEPDPLGQPLPGSAVLGYFDRREDESSGNAANKDRKNLRKAWTDGQDMVPGFPRLAVNPFGLVRKRREIRRPRYVPTAHDFWAVLNVAQGQDKVLLLTFLHLLARRGEVFWESQDRPGLTWGDVDFENNEVTLWTRKRQGGHLEANKLPMTVELRASLIWWREHRPVERETVFYCTAMRDDGLRHERWGQPSMYRRTFMHGLCKAAGVRPFGLHAIRHFTARHLHEQGYAVGFIRRILRHKSEATTRRYLEELGVSVIRSTVDDGMPRPADGADWLPWIDNNKRSTQ